MAIYHCSVKAISRGKNQSAVGKSAYRSAEDIKNERDGKTHYYTHKQSEIAYKELHYPEHISDEGKAKIDTRYKLWNSVEQKENRGNSRLAREVEVALPNELSREQNIDLLKDYSKSFTSRGMVADVCYHDKNDGNPHAHIMITERELDQDANWFKKKNRDWIKDEQVHDFRKEWEVVANQHLEKAETLANENRGLFQPKVQYDRISCDSLENQGIDRTPQIHVGVQGNNINDRGKHSERYQENERIKRDNREKGLDVEVKDVDKEIAKTYKELAKLEKQQAKQEKKERKQGKQYEPQKEVENTDPEPQTEKPITVEKPQEPPKPKPNLEEEMKKRKQADKEWREHQAKVAKKEQEIMSKFKFKDAETVENKGVKNSFSPSKEPTSQNDSTEKQSKLKERMNQDKGKEKQQAKPQQKESKFDFNTQKGDKQKEVKQQEQKAPQQQKKPKQKQQGRGR